VVLVLFADLLFGSYSGVCKDLNGSDALPHALHLSFGAAVAVILCSLFVLAVFSTFILSSVTELALEVGSWLQLRNLLYFFCTDSLLFLK